MSLTPVLLHDGHVPLQFGVDLIALPRFVLTAIKKLPLTIIIYRFSFDYFSFSAKRKVITD